MAGVSITSVRVRSRLQSSPFSNFPSIGEMLAVLCR
jgi:hypothetical protein